MNETIVVEDGHAAVATVAVSGTLMPESSATDIITTVQTNKGKQAAVKVYNIGGGGAGGDYLPLSGGTMTGPLYINNARFESAGLSLYIGKDGAPKVFCFDLGGGFIEPLADRFGKIGSSSKRWTCVYSTTLNNGADIAVPTTGGTMALKEDIDAAVGDISTALTAILGE